MTVTYITEIRNRTDKTFFMWTTENDCPGDFFITDAAGKSVNVGNNGTNLIFVIFPWGIYSAKRCAIPWQGKKKPEMYRWISTSKDKSRACLRMQQRNVDGHAWIDYTSTNPTNVLKFCQEVDVYTLPTDVVECSLEFSGATSEDLQIQLTTSGEGLRFRAGIDPPDVAAEVVWKGLYKLASNT